MGRVVVWFLVGLLIALTLVASPGPVWQPCARLSPPGLRECSGIVASRQFEDVLWTHNDSGDTARLFAVDRSGRLVREVHVRGARNVDWEDLTTDDAGNLYVGDIGNNKNERRDLVVYVLREPDPGAPGDAILDVPVRQRLPFYFPEQHHFPDPEQMNFDCEALYWDAGHLFVLTKHRSDARTVLYRLPAAGDAARGDSAAVRLGEAEIGSPVTAAALAPDGTFLAVLSYQYIHIFERPAGTENFLRGTSQRVLIEGRQCEGICCVGDEILFTNEQREIYCLRVADLRRESVFLPTPPTLQLSHARSCGMPAGTQPATPLPLHPEPPEAEIAPTSAPEVSAGWCDAGLELRGRWRVAPDVVPTGQTLLTLMCGPPGAAMPRLQPGQQVWEARWTATAVELRPVLPVPGAPLGGCVVRRSDHDLVLEALVPVAVAPGATLMLNVIAYEPAATVPREWVWAGGSSTQPLENPLLWGRVELLP